MIGDLNNPRSCCVCGWGVVDGECVSCRARFGPPAISGPVPRVVRPADADAAAVVAAITVSCPHCRERAETSRHVGFVRNALACRCRACLWLGEVDLADLPGDYLDE